jgi:hypothetical protein
MLLAGTVQGTEVEAPWESLRSTPPAASRPVVVKPELLERPGHGAIVGVVVDADSGLPLPGVTISVRGPNLTGSRVAVSDLEGTFSLGLPAGAHELEAELDGYPPTHLKEVVVRAQEARRVEVEMRLILHCSG